MKSDGTYFLSNRLGGRSLAEFGLGYRAARPTTSSHYGRRERSRTVSARPT